MKFLLLAICLFALFPGQDGNIDVGVGCRHLTNLLEDLPHRIQTVKFTTASNSRYQVNVTCTPDSSSSDPVDWCWLFNDQDCSCNVSNSSYSGDSVVWSIAEGQFLRFDGTVLGCFRGEKLTGAFYASELEPITPDTEGERQVVIGVSIAVGLTTTFLFIAPCFVLSYWSSRQTARRRPGLVTANKRLSRLSTLNFHTVRTIKEENINKMGLLGKGSFGGDIYRAKIKDISPDNPKRVYACVKFYDGAADKSLVQQQIDFRKNLKSHENVINFLGCFIGGKKMILALELGWYDKLLPFLEEKKRGMYMNSSADWNKLDDFQEVEEKLAIADYDSSVLENVIRTDDYLKAFTGPICDPIAEDTFIAIAVQIAMALDHLGKQMCVHKNLTCESAYISGNFVIKVGGFEAEAEQTVHANDMTDGPLLQKKTPSNRLLAKWSPPEAVDRLIFSQSSDVWSFGMMLWEMLSYGATPWEDTRLNGLVRVLMEGSVPAQPNRCSDNLYSVMRKCWVLDPNDRPGINTICRDLKRLIRLDSETPLGDKKRRSTLPMIDPILTTVHEEEDDISSIH